MEENSKKTITKGKRCWKEYSSQLTDYLARSGKKKTLQKKFNSHYLSPLKEDIQSSTPSIHKALRENSSLVIPMKEKEPVIDSLLFSVTRQMKSSSIYVVNDNSSKEAINTVKKYKKVNLIERDEILSVIKWEKLLPLLNLSFIPHGKGMAVLAGYLAEYIHAQLKKNPPCWIFQHDAEVSNYATHQGLEYLGWGLFCSGEEIQQIKTAKSGRNNESLMMSRSSLLMLEHLQGEENEKTRRRARELFERLSNLKWMVSGSFALRRDVAMQRPFATGYLEEVLTCAFVEDKGVKEKKKTLQVSNPNPCLEGENGFLKEWIILQEVSNFLFLLAIQGKPVDEWTVGDIEEINRSIMPRQKEMGVIPPEGDERPVQAETVPDERIIPSVKTLDLWGMINWKKAKKIMKRPSKNH